MHSILLKKGEDLVSLNIFYKSDFHEEQTNLILNKFGLTNLFQDVEYGVFAYIVGATYKAKDIVKAIDDEGTIDIDKLDSIIEFYSSSEKKMIEFALQLFNSRLSDIKLTHVMESLDDENTKVIKQAVLIRY